MIYLVLIISIIALVLSLFNRTELNFQFKLLEKLTHNQTKTPGEIRGFNKDEISNSISTAEQRSRKRRLK